MDHDRRTQHGATRYRVIRVIGRGSFGEVYEAVDALLQRRVAVKLIPRADRIPTLSRRALLGEAQMAAAAGRAAVQVHDLVETEGGTWLVMELVSGGSLRAWVEQPRSDAQVQAITASLAGRVAMMHELGLVHGDIHPGNVLVRADNDVALADFGLARAVTKTTKKRGAREIHWSAPEVLGGGQISPASDVYSLALVIGWLYRETGHPCPAAVRRGLAVAPHNRPPDGSAFVHQMSQVSESHLEPDADAELITLLREAALAVRAGRTQSAIGILERAMRHAPLDLRPRRRLALLRWTSGERQSAIWTLEAAQRLEPGDRMTNTMLANWRDVMDQA
jgi:tRNA A-37 threonylcarbamoyl transferase component Bud32